MWACAVPGVCLVGAWCVRGVCVVCAWCVLREALREDLLDMGRRVDGMCVRCVLRVARHLREHLPSLQNDDTVGEGEELRLVRDEDASGAGE